MVLVHSVPFILDDLLEAIDHACVVVLAGYGDIGLNLSVPLLFHASVQ